MQKPGLIKLFVIFSLWLAPGYGLTASQGKHLLVFGDSLSAAYGIEIEQGWASLLARHWQEQETSHQLTNASISGETTDGGLARLPLTLEEVQPDIVMIELGANDGVRGHPLTRISSNLEKMVALVEKSGAQAILVGISLPPSLNPRYVDRFRQVFPQLAEQLDVPFIDFYREDFYSIPGYMQRDGLHPTALPQPTIRDSLLSFFAEQELFE